MLVFHFCEILIFVHCSMTERLTLMPPVLEVWNANPGALQNVRNRFNIIRKNFHW